MLSRRLTAGPSGRRTREVFHVIDDVTDEQLAVARIA
jgi:hypothetical protein